MPANQALLQIVRNQPSFVFGTAQTRVAVTRTAGMLAPITFFANSKKPVEPYYVAPWADEGCPPDTINLLSVLRGDFFCAPFGGNSEAHDGVTYPPHGEAANEAWDLEGFEEDEKGATLRLTQKQKLVPGTITKTVAVRTRHSAIYQRHDLAGFSGPMTVGHHPCLCLPDDAGQAYLSFSPHRHAQTYVKPTEDPAQRGYSILKPDTKIKDLTQCPLAIGGTTDLTRWPARRGFEDIVLLANKTAGPFAWTAFSVPSRGYVWFSLKDPAKLASTLLWMSNGGRHYAPWNGRNFNCIGLEEITGFFHEGLAPSVRKNALSKLGIPTTLKLSPKKPASIAVIHAVARLPKNFTRVASIEPAGDKAVTLASIEGTTIKAALNWQFIEPD